MKINYSIQSMIIINALKEFNKADFEKWLLDNLEVGNSTIMSYLIDKEARKNGNIK